MEPWPEGLYAAESPPLSAGKQGRVSQYNWGRVLRVVMENPNTWLCARSVKTDDYDQLKKSNPEVLFLGWDHRMVKRPNGKETQVCDVWMIFPRQGGEYADGGDADAMLAP